MITRYHYERVKPSAKVAEKFGQPSGGTDELVGYLYPSGRVSIGVLPRATLANADSEYEATRAEFSEHHQCHWDKEDGLVRQNQLLAKPPLPLGLSSAPNHHSDAEPQRYGLKGISSNGRKCVEECAYLLQRKYGRRLGFYTLTCPYTDYSRVYEFNRNCSEIARRYFQHMRRLYRAKGLCWSYVSVYEYQNARYSRDGIPVLHIHYIAPCYVPGTKEWCVSATEIRYLWMLVCSQVIGGEVDTSAAVDAAVVRKSCIAYLAKYMGKGGDTISTLSNVCPSQIPGQWWGVSNNLRASLKRYTLKLPPEITEYLYHDDGKSSDFPLYVYRRTYISIPSGINPFTGYPFERRVGMSGYLSPKDSYSLQTWKAHI